LSAALGAICVAYLTTFPARTRFYAVLALGLLVAVLVMLSVGFAGRQFWLTLGVSGVLCVAGYVAMTARVLAREDTPPLPALTRTRGDLGDGHTAILYFTHGEPEAYDPLAWIRQFREFDAEKIPFVPFLVRPFFLYRVRQKYAQVGGSHHRQMHARMLQSLERAFREQGDCTTRFYLCFLDDNPRPDVAVIQALNAGASALIVSEVFLTISNHTAEGEKLIRDLHPEDYGVAVRFTGPLWDSETLQSMFLARANQAIGTTDKGKIGVILVGHGQPDAWDREFPTETEQETLFRQRILERFVDDGYTSENLGLAWMEFKEPRPAVEVEALVARGVEKIVYFSAAISADCIHSACDTPALMHQARVPQGFPRLNLGAWNDDPLVIQAIKAKIDRLRKDVPA
jgi:protoheme ferro-lyase